MQLAFYAGSRFTNCTEREKSRRFSFPTLLIVSILTQVVDAKLHLKAILCLGVWTHHDPSVINENVNLTLFWKKGRIKNISICFGMSECCLSCIFVLEPYLHLCVKYIPLSVAFKCQIHTIVYPTMLYNWCVPHTKVSSVFIVLPLSRRTSGLSSKMLFAFSMYFLHMLHWQHLNSMKWILCNTSVYDFLLTKSSVSESKCNSTQILTNSDFKLFGNN